MSFQKRVVDIMNIHGEHDILELTDQRGVFQFGEHTITFQRLPELETKLNERFGDYSFCVYQSDQYDDAFGEIEIQFKLTDTTEVIVLEFDFWLLHQKEVEVWHKQFQLVQGDRKLFGFNLTNEEAKIMGELLPLLKEEVIAYATNMPAYRLFFATGDITFIPK